MGDEKLPVPGKQPLKKRLLEGLVSYIVIFLYLWVVFALLSIHKSLVLTQHNLDVEEHAFAFINALVFGKVILIGEEFHLGARFRDKPLIYTVLYDCFIYSLLLIAFHIVETIAVGVWHGNTVANSYPPVLSWSTNGLLAVGVMCFVLLFPFFCFRELAHVVGARKMHRLFLGRRDADDMEPA